MKDVHATVILTLACLTGLAALTLAAMLWHHWRDAWRDAWRARRCKRPANAPARQP